MTTWRAAFRDGTGNTVAAVLVFLACIIVLPVRAAAEEFDRSFPVRAGTSLDVRLYGGEVVIRGSDRNTVRVRATHFKTDEIDVQTARSSLAVRAKAKVGAPHAIDVTLDVPSWMPVTIAGTYVDVSITGVQASVSAETVRGDVRVSGGTGVISLKSIEGDVTLEEASGRAALTAVNNSIRVRAFEGDLVATTVNGTVSLVGVQSMSVDVGTVGGDISWTGAVPATGRYQFATHTGDIDVALGRDPNAAVSVRLFGGQFRSAFPASGTSGPQERRKRFNVVLGSGAAHLDLETFRGTISLRQ